MVVGIDCIDVGGLFVLRILATGRNFFVVVDVVVDVVVVVGACELVLVVCSDILVAISTSLLTSIGSDEITVVILGDVGAKFFVFTLDIGCASSGS